MGYNQLVDELGSPFLFPSSNVLKPNKKSPATRQVNYPYKYTTPMCTVVFIPIYSVENSETYK